MGILNKKPKTEKYKPIYGERVTQISAGNSQIYNSGAKTLKLLERLRGTYNDFDCIELLVEEHPDVSMAREMLLSLSCQGGEIQFSGRGASRIKEEWEDFCSRLNSVSSTGLDGLIRQATDNFLVRSGIGYEIVVNDEFDGIEDVYLINPKTLKFVLDKETQKFKIYQVVNGEEIDLSQSNFRWIPFNPTSDSPKGTLLFKSAISPADMQLEFFNSSQVVLYRVGTPRYKITIDINSVMESAPSDIKADPSGIKLREYINSVIANITNNLRSIGVKNDFVVTSDTTIDTVGVNNSAFFQGISSFAEIIDTQMLNGLKVLGTLMNRHQQGGSYALSTVEFKAIVDMLQPVQRAIKRMVEDIARVWLRVNGYVATVKYTPNPIEWQTFKDKMEYKLKKQEYYRRAEEYGHISPDEATQNTIGNDKAYNPTENLFEYVKNAKNGNENNGGDNE